MERLGRGIRGASKYVCDTVSNEVTCLLDLHARVNVVYCSLGPRKRGGGTTFFPGGYISLSPPGHPLLRLNTFVKAGKQLQPQARIELGTTSSQQKTRWLTRDHDVWVPFCSFSGEFCHATKICVTSAYQFMTLRSQHKWPRQRLHQGWMEFTGYDQVDSSRHKNRVHRQILDREKKRLDLRVEDGRHIIVYILVVL